MVKGLIKVGHNKLYNRACRSSVWQILWPAWDMNYSELNKYI